MAAISRVFTIRRVAEMLGQDPARLERLACNALEPEDGRLFIFDADGQAATALTEAGVECLQEILRESRS